MLTFAISTGRGDVRMSNFFMRMMREARVKQGPTRFNYYSHCKFTKDNKRLNNLYEYILMCFSVFGKVPMVVIVESCRTFFNSL